MDRGKKPISFLGNSSNKLYMDLKDIIREHALSFLPAKSALKFRVVCRDWKLRISTPFFAHNQSLSFKGVLGIFCQAHGQPPSFIPLTPESCGVPDPSLGFLPEPVTLRSSSNGLVCCQGHTGYNAYYVCNPVTKQWLKLPKQTANHGPNPPTVLVFEPSLLNFVAEFKLICPFQSEDFENAMEFDIYSSSQGSWKVSPEICFAGCTVKAGTGLHAKGVVYWQSSSHGLVSYDLKQDKYEIKNSYGYYGYNHSIFISGHRYRSSHIYGARDGKIFSVYTNGTSLSVTPVQCNYSSSMTTIHNYRSSGTRNTTSSFTLDSRALMGVQYQQLQVIVAAQDVVCVRAGDTILCYNVMKNETKVVGKMSGDETVFLPYVNSLVYI